MLSAAMANIGNLRGSQGLKKNIKKYIIHEVLKLMASKTAFHVLIKMQHFNSIIIVFCFQYGIAPSKEHRWMKHRTFQKAKQDSVCRQNAAKTPTFQRSKSRLEAELHIYRGQ